MIAQSFAGWLTADAGQHAHGGYCHQDGGQGAPGAVEHLGGRANQGMPDQFTATWTLSKPPSQVLM